MIEKQFCNYNRDYQQRLGFLKVVNYLGEGARGGPDDILERARAIFPGGRWSTLVGRPTSPVFDPKALIRREAVPSWIVGFVPKTLDRLISWAEMVGLIAQSGRLSEWSTILQGIHHHEGELDWEADNPFVLSDEERAFFIQLLFYHDQVLPFLVHHLGGLDAGRSIGVAESCVLVTRSIGDLYDHIHGNSPNELQLRAELRDLLERVGKQYRLDDPRALVNAEARQDIVKALAGDRLRGVRVRLAEYHAICRFEQLTDLGLLTKEDPENPPVDEGEKEKQRTSWRWYVAPGLAPAASILRPHLSDLEPFFQTSWLHFCAAALVRRAHQVDALRDQRLIASLLDATLPLARRQLGPVQVHTWASLTCVRALNQGHLLELQTVGDLLNAMRSDPHTASAVRLSGRQGLRGRTAAVPKTGLSEVLENHIVSKRTAHGDT